MRIGTKSLLDGRSCQAGWSGLCALWALVHHHLPVGCEVRLLRHPALRLVHQLSLVSPLDNFLYDLLFISACADLVMRRIAMKYKTSTTSSYHWCGAWGDIGGILALRAGGRRQSLGPRPAKLSKPQAYLIQCKSRFLLPIEIDIWTWICSVFFSNTYKK